MGTGADPNSPDPDILQANATIFEYRAQTPIFDVESLALEGELLHVSVRMCFAPEKD